MAEDIYGAFFLELSFVRNGWLVDDSPIVEISLGAVGDYSVVVFQGKYKQGSGFVIVKDKDVQIVNTVFDDYFGLVVGDQVSGSRGVVDLVAVDGGTLSDQLKGLTLNNKYS